MIHCYFGDYSSHKNEVKMFDRFLSQLQLDWNTPDNWIYVIFNAMWNGEEIDIVCFTENAIIVADLKNYSGHLSGGENGAWDIKYQNETIEVKGGGQINPYVQIRKNKFSVINWIKQNQYFTNSQVDHVSAMIIFNEIETCQMDLPQKVIRWLQISDLPHCSDDFIRLNHSNIQLDESEVRQLIEKMKLHPYQWQAAPLTAVRFNPFTPSVAESYTATQYAKNASSQLNTHLKTPSKFKEIYFPLLLTILIAYTAGYFFLEQNIGIFDVISLGKD